MVEKLHLYVNSLYAPASVQDKVSVMINSAACGRPTVMGLLQNADVHFCLFIKGGGLHISIKTHANVWSITSPITGWKHKKKWLITVKRLTFSLCACQHTQRYMKKKVSDVFGKPKLSQHVMKQSVKERRMYIVWNCEKKEDPARAENKKTKCFCQLKEFSSAHNCCWWRRN